MGQIVVFELRVAQSALRILDKVNNMRHTHNLWTDSMTTPLRMAREKRGLTIQQVASTVGIDPGNLSRIERGKQVPSKDLAEKLCQVFGGEVTETHIIYPERFGGLEAVGHA
jgi:DNA-binding XRE family transcriptional regulator